MLLPLPTPWHICTTKVSRQSLNATVFQTAQHTSINVSEFEQLRRQKQSHLKKEKRKAEIHKSNRRGPSKPDCTDNVATLCPTCTHVHLKDSPKRHQTSPVSPTTLNKTSSASARLSSRLSSTKTAPHVLKPVKHYTLPNQAWCMKCGRTAPLAGLQHSEPCARCSSTK